MVISSKDRAVLRELAKQQQEYAHLPIMEQRETMWRNHNALIGKDVPIHFEVGSFSHELTPPLKTTIDFARNIEWNLYGNMLILWAWVRSWTKRPLPRTSNNH